MMGTGLIGRQQIVVYEVMATRTAAVSMRRTQLFTQQLRPRTSCPVRVCLAALAKRPQRTAKMRRIRTPSPRTRTTSHWLTASRSGVRVP